MKKILLILMIIASCSKPIDNSNPLIIPPNFTEVPDPKNPEQPTEQDKAKDVEKLKELLLKSE